MYVCVGRSWLWVQNWLFHKMVSVVNAPSPAWNRYWVCLKGTVLLFYLRQQTSLGGQNDRNPRHSLGKSPPPAVAVSSQYSVEKKYPYIHRIFRGEFSIF